jgi:pyridoxine 5-phosphate synthase
MLKLGVNVDHVATVRQARRAVVPDPLEAALICEKAGAMGITAHLREDRRHINDNDMDRLSRKVQRLNMEMAVTEEMLNLAVRFKPSSCCLVPEKRAELTTEGGLDVIGKLQDIAETVNRLQDASIIVSLFIDPEIDQIDAAFSTGTDFIELHTGAYANSHGHARQKELNRLVKAAEYAKKLNIGVNAGHGIDYENMDGILEIPYLEELNIGHSIISRAVIVGMENAVREMLDLMSEYPS